MPKNDNVSQLDSAQAFKRSFDDANDAIRVVQTNDVETAISVSAEDNDSVQSVARSRTGATIACSDLREVSVFISPGTGNVALYVSPSSSGNDWYLVDSYAADGANPKVYGPIKVCAARAKIEPGLLTASLYGRS